MRVDNDTNEAPEDRKRRMARDRKRKQRRASAGENDYEPGVRVAKKWDRDACPPGWDAVIWHLTLFFEQSGEAYGHSSNGRPVIYTLLEHRVDSTDTRNHVGRLADRAEDDQPWVRLVKRMITYFWDWQMDPDKPRNAINDFTQLGEFLDLRDTIIQNIELDIKHEEYLEAKAKGENTCACHNRPAHENHKRIS